MSDLSVSIRWIGQAGFILSTHKHTIVIDPYCSDSIAHLGFNRRYPSFIEKHGLSLDAVFSTHNHGDHLDIITLTEYIDFSRFYGPDSCIAEMKKAGFSNEKLISFNRNDSVQEGDFKLTAVYADHTEDSIGLVVHCSGFCIYFTGDSRYDPALLSVKEYAPDLLFTCITGKFNNLDYKEASYLAKKLEVKTAIPMHYEMFDINSEDPSNFTNEFAESEIKAIILKPGCKYDLASLVRE